MERERYIAFAPHTRTIRDAKRVVRFQFPGAKIVSGRRVDPMDVKRGFKIVFDV